MATRPADTEESDDADELADIDSGPSRFRRRPVLAITVGLVVRSS
jgi:hypothetical protein